MSWQADMFAAITGDNAITAIVGLGVFPDVADASASVPYIVYQDIYTGGETTHDGKRNLEFPMVQLACWAATKAAAVALGDLVCNLLDGATLAGDSDITFQFSNRMGNYDAEERIFGEIIELRASANRNQ
jgi:hypothetical protein